MEGSRLRSRCSIVPEGGRLTDRIQIEFTYSNLPICISPIVQSVAIAIYKRIRQAFATDAMKRGLADTREYFPGPAVQTDAQILDTVRDTLMTVWHASCTCKMDKSDHLDAVVDSKARVIGVTGLRVVDASAFALLPPGHPQSTVYALAEKIADAIKSGR